MLRADAGCQELLSSEALVLDSHLSNHFEPDRATASRQMACPGPALPIPGPREVPTARGWSCLASALLLGGVVGWSWLPVPALPVLTPAAPSPRQAFWKNPTWKSVSKLCKPSGFLTSC